MKIFRLASLIFAGLVVYFYCAVSYSRAAATVFSFTEKSESGRQKSYFSPSGSIPGAKAVFFRNNVKVMNRLPFVTIKRHCVEHSTDSKYAEMSRISRCCRYLGYAESTIIRIEGADIIFPSQYFW